MENEDIKLYVREALMEYLLAMVIIQGPKKQIF